jgi:hypothetical protein
MADRLRTPRFANEAEEAQWWFDHRDELTGAFEDAAARGIRLDPVDICRARDLAAKRGLRYQERKFAS